MNKLNTISSIDLKMIYLKPKLVPANNIDFDGDEINNLYLNQNAPEKLKSNKRHNYVH
jgi:hypothetical protein